MKREEVPRTSPEGHHHLMRQGEVVREEGEKPRECNVKIIIIIIIIENTF